jgi:hypothetical protein
LLVDAFECKRFSVVSASALVVAYGPGLKKQDEDKERAERRGGLYRRRLRGVGEGDAAAAVKAEYTLSLADSVAGSPCCW